MELLVATLCDSASETQGKLNITGAFDTIIAQSFPAGFSFSLALRFLFTAKDHGSHTFSMHLSDGSDEAPNPPPNEAQMEVSMIADEPAFSTQNMISPLEGTVQKAGIYHFEVKFDRAVLARIPFRVIQGELPPAAL